MAPMRILVISGLYPPHTIGGYELGCRTAVRALERRGHQLKVLCSNYGGPAKAADPTVVRRLPWRAPGAVPPLNRLPGLVRDQLRSDAVLRDVTRKFQPDLLYCFVPYGVSLPSLRRVVGTPICFFVSDHWLLRWAELDPWLQFWNAERAPRLVRLARWALRPANRWAGLDPDPRPPPLDHVQFVSHSLREEAAASGLAVSHGAVIHWGIEVDRFPWTARTSRRPLRLLFSGRLNPTKGAETAIDAVAALRNLEVRLDIVGEDPTLPDYRRSLERRVAERGLNDRVRFRGKVSADEMPRVYAEHDVLLFPAVWEEPFSITLLEAMASGLPVVATPTGGTPELVEDGRNGLLFPVGDFEACAECVVRLAEDPALMTGLSRNARRRVEVHYTIDRFGAEVERHLEELLR